MIDSLFFWSALFIVGACVSAFCIGREWGKCEGEMRQLDANWKTPKQ